MAIADTIQSTANLINSVGNNAVTAAHQYKDIRDTVKSPIPNQSSLSVSGNSYLPIIIIGAVVLFLFKKMF